MNDTPSLRRYMAERRNARLADKITKEHADLINESLQVAAPQNISPDQLVGEHVCDIDCWDNFYVVGDAFSDPMLGCRHRGDCPGIDHTVVFMTLGDMIVEARKHCLEYHQ